MIRNHLTVYKSNFKLLDWEGNLKEIAYDNWQKYFFKDMKRLYHSLPNVVDMYEVPRSKFNHVDFMWDRDASKLVYDRILKIMRGENPHNVTSVEYIVNNQN